jgi:hypothetical protein
LAVYHLLPCIASIRWRKRPRPRLDRGNAALYFPWLRAADPLRGASVRDFAPCGAAAGLPRDDKRLAALGVNTIRELPQLGHVVWGVRALDMSGEWKYVSVPRVALYLDESLNRGTRWVVFEPNDEPLWRRSV